MKPGTEYELVFETPAIAPFKRTTVTGEMHIADHTKPVEVRWAYRVVVNHLRSAPVTGWLLHSLRVGKQEQLLADTGVPLQILLSSPGPLLRDSVLVDDEPVTLILSHRMTMHNGGIHAAKVCMFALPAS